METSCLTCGKMFEAWPCKRRKYCSRKCSLGQQHPRGEPYRWLWNKIRYEAKKAGRGCSLTFNQFLRFVRIKQCHYCKASINWTPHAGRNARCYYLDRKDNCRGYSRKNCVVCCSRCNRAKSYHFTYAEWKAIGRVIRGFQR